MGKIRVVFGILSSQNSAVPIQQIIDAIGPGHTVIIHHDFSKQPDFHVSGNDVYVIEDYVITGWGGWSLVEATLRLMQTAIANGEFDYFQLLSDTCLPVRPVQEFVDFLATTKPDANIDHVTLLNDEAVMLSHGYRAFAAKNTMRHKLLRRLKLMREQGGTRYQQVAGLSIFMPMISSQQSIRFGFFTWLNLLVLKLAARGLGFSHPFGKQFECHAGSQWFGCSRAMCQRVLEWTTTHAGAFAYFKRMHIPDEFFFQTVIANMQPHSIQPSNHFVNSFDTEGRRGPAFLDVSDIDRLVTSGKFFARKFPKEPGHPLRMEMIRRCA